MGGFVGGMIAGAVAIGVFGVLLSLNTPLSRRPSVAVQVPEPTPVETPETVADATDSGSDSDLVELPPSSLEEDSGRSDTLTELSDMETAPDTQPQVNDKVDQVDAPDVTNTSGITVSTEAPLAPQAPDPVQVSPDASDAPVVIADAPQPTPVETEDFAVAEPLPEPQTDARLTQPEQPEVDPFKDNPIAVEGDEDTLPRDRPKIAALPQIGSDQVAPAATLGKRVVPLTERDDAPEADNSADIPPAAGKPIQAYSAKFDNPESKPLMSIILIDDEGAYGAEALQDFPYPISFAVSPSDPNASEKMAKHREAGFEVLALADLPKAATAQDAEVSLSVWLDALPETVGILEGVGTGIQGNRKLADQVAVIAGGTGRGLITQDNGLNTVQKLAARNGIPSSVIFRDIDGARQNPKIMRRFLDQAAFRAGQEGTVVMLGRLRPDTISALLLWGLEDRGNRVAMAPISAVMMKEVQ
ncbi:divergent polysaccharide deacetylase family protein [Ruegeria halocynthiae]|uniref:divergent polysaccharide deacetylase family protein n=1 Tax=Ruegeria halocynthiae TaxID=985054 RepID=UPI0005607333|nr:divergent polysaccharide deacetylase family protein [Ruegeria halocynthiae]